MTGHIQSPVIEHYSTILTLYNACICIKLTYSKLFHNCILSHIQNPVIFTKIHKLTCLKPDTYLEPSQRFKMEFFAKIVKNYNYFSKMLHLRSLTRFWICLSVHRYSLTFRVTSRYIFWYIFRTLSIIVNSDCGIFRTLCNSGISWTLPYSESWHI